MFSTAHPVSFFSRWCSIFSDFDGLWMEIDIIKKQLVSSNGDLNFNTASDTMRANIDEKAWIIDKLTESLDDNLLSNIIIQG